jgi:hypothetical protein
MNNIIEKITNDVFSNDTFNKICYNLNTKFDKQINEYVSVQNLMNILTNIFPDIKFYYGYSEYMKFLIYMEASKFSSGCCYPYDSCKLYTNYNFYIDLIFIQPSTQIYLYDVYTIKIIFFENIDNDVYEILKNRLNQQEIKKNDSFRKQIEYLTDIQKIQNLKGITQQEINKKAIIIKRYHYNDQPEKITLINNSYEKVIYQDYQHILSNPEHKEYTFLIDELKILLIDKSIQYIHPYIYCDYLSSCSYLYVENIFNESKIKYNKLLNKKLELKNNYDLLLYIANETNDEHNELQNKYNELKKDNDLLNDNLELINKHNKSLNDEILELKNNFDELSNKNNLLIDEYIKLKNNYDEISNKNNLLMDENLELKNNYDEISNKNNLLNDEYINLKNNYDEISKKNNLLIDELLNKNNNYNIIIILISNVIVFFMAYIIIKMNKLIIL